MTEKISTAIEMVGVRPTIAFAGDVLFKVVRDGGSQVNVMLRDLSEVTALRDQLSAFIEAQSPTHQ